MAGMRSDPVDKFNRNRVVWTYCGCCPSCEQHNRHYGQVADKVTFDVASLSPEKRADLFAKLDWPTRPRD